MNPRSVVSGALVVALAIAGRTARADGGTPIEVSVVGSRADTLPKLAGSGTVIGAREIERAAAYDASEILRRAPGVQVREEYGGGQRFDISVRGLEAGRSRRVLVLEDGIPIALNPYAEPDLYFSPLIERTQGIEVVKGSGNILYGPQTVGGVVNFLSIAPPETRQVRVDVQGGERAYVRGLARYGDRSGPLRYVVQALHKQGDGFRGDAFRTTDVLAKAAFEGVAGSAVVKFGIREDAADSGAVGLTRELYANNPREPSLAPHDRLKLRRIEASLIHDAFLGASTTLRSTLFGYTLGRIWRRQNYAREPAPEASYERIVGDPSFRGGALYFLPTNTILDRSYEVAGLEERLTLERSTGALRHTFDAGARLVFEGAHYQQRAGETPSSFSGALGFEEHHRTLAISGFLNERLTVRRDLVVTLGVRVEHARFTRSILRRTDGTGAHDVDITGTSSTTALIPGLGMVYGTRNAHLFGGLHVGWAPPRIAASVSPNGIPAEIGSERSVNYELGARARLERWLTLELTGFLTVFHNQVVFDASPGEAMAESDAGRTERHGAESQATFELGRALRWATTLDLRARYTLLQTRFLGGPNDGRSLPYAPAHTGSAALELEHPSGLGGTLAASFTGPQFTDVANTVAEDATGKVGRIDAHYVLDAGAHYRHRPSGLSVSVTVKNALDDVYIAARRPEGIFTSGFRQVMLGLRWEYSAGRPS